MKTVIIYESVYGNTRQVADGAGRRWRGGTAEDVVDGPRRRRRTDLKGRTWCWSAGPPTSTACPDGATRQGGRGTAPPAGGANRGPTPRSGTPRLVPPVGRVDGTAAAAFDTRLDGPRS